MTIATRTVEFVIPGRWTPERKRHVRRGNFQRRVDTSQAADFKAKVALFAAQASGSDQPFDEPLRAEIAWVAMKPRSYRKHEGVPWRKPDLDNLCKAVLDGLTGIVFRDDAQIVELALRKEFGSEEFVLVRVEPGVFEGLGESVY